MLDMRLPSVAPWLIGLSCFAIPAAPLQGCSSDSPRTSPDGAPPSIDGAPPPPPPPIDAAAVLHCDDSMKTAFKPDGNTSVLLVHAFNQGDPLALGPTT